MAGIYGNDAAEALYPLLAAASDGKKPDCGANRYTLTFPAGQLPPAHLINSPMLPNLEKNPDGSLTIYIQRTRRALRRNPPGPARSVINRTCL